MNSNDIDGAAIKCLTYDIVFVSLILGSSGATGQDLYSRTVDDRLHVSRPAAVPVIRIVVLELANRGNHRFVLDVEAKNDRAELTPWSPEIWGLKVKYVCKALVVGGFGCGR